MPALVQAIREPYFDEVELCMAQIRPLPLRHLSQLGRSLIQQQFDQATLQRSTCFGRADPATRHVILHHDRKGRPLGWDHVEQDGLEVRWYMVASMTAD